jgi:hypothetical protein
VTRCGRRRMSAAREENCAKLCSLWAIPAGFEPSVRASRAEKVLLATGFRVYANTVAIALVATLLDGCGVAHDVRMFAPGWCGMDRVSATASWPPAAIGEPR